MTEHKLLRVTGDRRPKRLRDYCRSSPCAVLLFSQLIFHGRELVNGFCQVV